MSAVQQADKERLLSHASEMQTAAVPSICSGYLVLAGTSHGALAKTYAMR